MFEHPLSESSWRRARDDTLLAFRTIRLWVVFVAWEGVLMFVPSLMTTVSISRWEFAGIQAGIFFGGMLMLLGAVFLVSLLFAPYRQRNEARGKIGKLERPKLFDVLCPTISLGLPINRLGSGSYQASGLEVGFRPLSIVHRGELTNVTRLTASLEVRFTRQDNKGWTTTNAIRVAPSSNPLASPRTMEFTWDISNPRLWILQGLPLTMAKDELLTLPMMMVSVVDGNEAGAHFDKKETCTLIIKLAVRTDKGSPPLPDQVIKLTMSDVGDIKDTLSKLGI